MGGYLGASWWRRRPYWGWTRRTRTSTPWWKTWTKIVRQNYKLHAFTCSSGQWLKYHVKSVHSCEEPSVFFIWFRTKCESNWLHNVPNQTKISHADTFTASSFDDIFPLSFGIDLSIFIGKQRFYLVFVWFLVFVKFRCARGIVATPEIYLSNIL